MPNTLTEKLNADSNGDFEIAADIVKRMEVMPVECMWAFIKEFQEVTNACSEQLEPIAFEQAADALWWRASCEWDI